MFEIKNLNLSFKEQLLFQSANLTLEKPGLYALVANNGIGKTMFFKMLSGVLHIGSFEAFFDGRSSQETRDCITYVPNEKAVFDNLTLMENLLLVSSNKEKIQEYIHFFHLEERVNRKCKKLSAGEYQCTAIIQATLENQPILLLDEPLSHIDKDTSDLILQFLKKISKNRYVIFSTHKMASSDQIDSIITIKNYQFSKNDLTLLSDEKIIEEPIQVHSKIVNKLVYWLPNLCFSLILSCLVGVICIALTSLFLPKEQIILNELKKSGQYVYALDSYNANESFMYADLPLSKDSKPPTFPTEAKAILTNNFLKDGAFAYIDQNTEDDFVFSNTAFASAIILTNQFQNQVLHENEVILSEAAYQSLASYHLIEYTEIPTISIYGDIYKIVKVFDVPELPDFETAEKECYSYINHLYYKWYMNEVTYQKMVSSCISFCNNLYFYSTFDSKEVQLGTEKQEVSIGKLPQNSDEILISTAYLQEHPNFSQHVGSGTPVFIELYGRTTRNTEIRFFKEYKISGVYDSEISSIQFFDEIGYTNFLQGGFKTVETPAYSPEQLTCSQLNEILDSRWALSTELNTQIQAIKKEYSNTQRYMYLILGVSLFLFLMFYIISTILYRSRKCDIYLKLNRIVAARGLYKKKMIIAEIINSLCAVLCLGLMVSFPFIHILNLYLMPIYHISHIFIGINHIILWSSACIFILLNCLKYRFVL